MERNVATASAWTERLDSASAQVAMSRARCRNGLAGFGAARPASCCLGLPPRRPDLNLACSSRYAGLRRLRGRYGGPLGKRRRAVSVGIWNIFLDGGGERNGGPVNWTRRPPALGRRAV